MTGKQVNRYTGKSYDELTFTDDFLFGKILYTRPDLCRKLLELLLNVEIEKIRAVETQKFIKTSGDAKGVRMDVYVRDGKGSVYDIEMQTVNSGSLEKRSRYYLSMMDQDCIEEGRKYADLKDSCVIFICNFDYYHKGLPVMEFRRTCLQDKSIVMNDGAHTVIINSHGDTEGLSDGMKDFIEYIRSGKAGKSLLVQELDEQVQEARKNKKWGLEYMTLKERVEEMMAEDLAEARAEARAEGLAEGREEGRAEGISLGKQDGIREEKFNTARNMLKMNLSDSQIVQATGLSRSEVQSLKK